MTPFVISASGDEPISLAQAAANLRVDDDDNSPPGFEDSSDIAGMITEAREHCENELELSLIEKTLELRMDAFPLPCWPYRAALQSWRHWVIELPWGPVRSIESVKYIDGDGNDTTLAADQYRFVATQRVKPAVLYPAFGAKWPACRRDHDSVRIRYVVGYPSDDSPAEMVPTPIVRAMHLLIAHYYANREAVDASSLAELPLGVQSLLNHYRQGIGV